MWHNIVDMNFWKQFQPSFTILAPMEGVTDIAFRQVIAKAARPDIFYTEFTNVNSYISEKGRHNALERFRIEESERPIVPQIWGTKPEMFAETAIALKKMGFPAVEAALTVHLRTKKEMSKVAAHYELIPNIITLKKSISPETVLIINGDIEKPADAQKYIDMGVDGVMIGRGVFRNPFCFEKKPREHGDTYYIKGNEIVKLKVPIENQSIDIHASAYFREYR